MYDFDFDYDTPDHPLDHGYVSVDSLPDFDKTCDYLMGIQEALYKDGDVKKLEHCLEELCHQYDCRFSAGKPVLENVKKRDLFQWFLGYQRAEMDRGIRTFEDYKLCDGDKR